VHALKGPDEEECMVFETLGAVTHIVEHAAEVVFAAQAPGPDTDPFVPTPTAVPIPGMDGMANTFIGWLRWVLIIGGVAGLLICGIMMAVGRRGRSTLAADGAAGVPWVLGGLLLGSVAAFIVSAVL
jgi:hypothetical protein